MLKANTFTAFSFLSALGIEGVSLGYLLALKSVFHFTIMSQCPHFMYTCSIWYSVLDILHIFENWTRKSKPLRFQQF